MTEEDARASPPAAAWLAIVATFAGLLVGFALKFPCSVHGWDGYQYSHLCYNDVQPLYHVRGISRGLVPYRDVQVEYPVLTGTFMDLSGRLLKALPFESVFPDTDQGYFRLSVILLSPFAFITTFALRRLVPRERLMIWAAGTPIVLYAFHNWDLIAVSGLAWGIAAFERGANFGSGAALALGASAKLYPAFAWPAVILARIAERKRGEAWRIVAGSGIAAAIVNVPWIIASSGVPPVLFRPDWKEVVGDVVLRAAETNGWLGVWTFHAGRYPDFGTFWFWIAHHGRALVPSSWWDPGQSGYRDLVSYLSLVLFAAGAVSFLVRGWRRKDDDGYPVAAATLGIVASFLLVSKVHSPQYALWVVPLLALTNVRWRVIAAYLGTDLLVYVSGFYWFTVFDSPSPAWKGIFEVSVLARSVAIGALIWSAWRASRLKPRGTEVSSRS